MKAMEVSVRAAARYMRLLRHSQGQIPTLVAVSVAIFAPILKAQPVIQLQHVYRPSDTLTVPIANGLAGTDPKRICVIFSGLAGCSTATSVTPDGNSFTVDIPADAVTGAAVIQREGRAVASFQIQIDRASGFQNALTALFNRISGNYLNYLLALAGLGVLSMSIVDAIKNLIPIRQLYQWRRTRWWLEQNIKEAAVRLEEIVGINEMQTELVLIGAGGNGRAFYNAQPDEFFQQFQVISRLVLNYPTNRGRHLSYSSILAVLASNVSRADFDIVTERVGSSSPQEKLDARNRIQQQMSQSLNAFQLSTSWWWQNSLQISAFVFSAAIAFFAVSIAYGGVRSNFWGILLTALFAAFLAPVAHDMVSAVQKLRS